MKQLTMNDMANSQLPLPIVLAFSGFILSILFPEKIHPFSATGTGFVAGFVIVRLFDQIFDRLPTIPKLSRQPESSTEEWDDSHGDTGSLAGSVEELQVTPAMEAWLEELLGSLPTPAAGVEPFRVTPAMEVRLEELLGSLPDTLRVPIVLRYQEDMLPEEIAALLNQPIATVKSHLQRGLKLMRRKAAVTMKEYKRERDSPIEEQKPARPQ